jgi:hypothetical protein
LGDPELIEMLLRKGGTKQLVGRHGMEWTPLMCGYGSLAAVSTILRVLEDIQAKGDQDEDLVGSAPAFPEHPSGPTDIVATTDPDSHTISVAPTPSTPSPISAVPHITAALLLAQTNEQGQTLFHLASLHGSAKVVLYLLTERRSDLCPSGDITRLIREPDVSGRTCLMLAAAGAGYGDQEHYVASRVETVRLLFLACSEDEIRAMMLEDVTPQGRNAAMLAAENGNIETLALLLSLSEPHGLLADVLGAVDGLGLAMPSMILAARNQKPWLRAKLDAALELVSNLNTGSPAHSPGTPMVPPGTNSKPPPIKVINSTAAGQTATVSIEQGIEELDIGDKDSSPGSAVGQQSAGGLRRKGTGSSRGSEEA